MSKVDKDSPAAGNPNDPRTFDALDATLVDGPCEGRSVVIPNKTCPGDAFEFDGQEYEYRGFGIFRHVTKEEA